MSISATFSSWLSGQTDSNVLMRRYQKTGDRQVLAKLYDQLADDLYHFVLTQSDATLAKDVCQKAWLKVIEKRHHYQHQGHCKAWLFTITRNLLIDELRHTGRLSLYNEQQDTEPFSPPDMAMSAAFDCALQGLPFEQREAFCLQQEGFSLKQIADITHAPLETTKTRLRYAKAALKKRLEKYHE